MERAVVIGGSFAGLLAARVLGRYSDEVIVIDADDIHTTIPELRRGAPHIQQYHALLEMGRRQLEQLFPGIWEEMIANGAAHGEGTALRVYHNGTIKPPCEGISVLGATRSFIEEHIRRHVFDDSRIKFLNGRVGRLQIVRGSVRGVELFPKLTVSPGSADSNRIHCDVVVDATGRSSRLSDWLRTAGWPEPLWQRVKIDVGYATGVFQSIGELPDLVAVQSFVEPPYFRAPAPDLAVMGRIENNRWLMVLVAHAERRPSCSVDDFLTRCLAAPAPPFREVIENCRLMEPINTYRTPDNRRRNFLKLPSFPAGLFAIGDSIAAFNPMYAQGLTCAALQATALDEHMKGGIDAIGNTREYFKRVQKIVNQAWGMATLNDYAQPHVTGPFPPALRVSHYLATLINRASVTDREVNQRLMNVISMCDPPSVLTRPGTLARTVRATLLSEHRR